MIGARRQAVGLIFLLFFFFVLAPTFVTYQSGKVQKGDLVTMISATFGDEMWSARGAGLSMIMQAIKVRRKAECGGC
jgi:hypothetical protein